MSRNKIKAYTQDTHCISEDFQSGTEKKG